MPHCFELSVAQLRCSAQLRANCDKYEPLRILPYGALLQRSVTALLLHCHLPLCCSKSALLCLLSFCFTLSITRFANILLDFELRRSTLALLFGARALHRCPASVLWYNALLRCYISTLCYSVLLLCSITVFCFGGLLRRRCSIRPKHECHSPAQILHPIVHRPAIHRIYTDSPFRTRLPHLASGLHAPRKCTLTGTTTSVRLRLNPSASDPNPKTEHDAQTPSVSTRFDPASNFTLTCHSSDCTPTCQLMMQFTGLHFSAFCPTVSS